MLSSRISSASAHAANFIDKNPAPSRPAVNTSSSSHASNSPSSSTTLPPSDSPEIRALYRTDLKPPHYLRRTWSGGDLRKLSAPETNVHEAKDLESEINSLIIERDVVLERLENMERVVDSIAGEISQAGNELAQKKNASVTTRGAKSKGVQSTVDSENDQQKSTAKSSRGGKKHDAASAEQSVSNLKIKLQQKDAQLSEKTLENKSLKNEVTALQQQLKDAKGDVRRAEALTEVGKRFNEKKINEIRRQKDAENDELRHIIQTGYKKEVQDAVYGLTTAMNLYAAAFSQIDNITKGPGFEEIQAILVDYVDKRNRLLASREPEARPSSAS